MEIGSIKPSIMVQSPVISKPNEKEKEPIVLNNENNSTPSTFEPKTESLLEDSAAKMKDEHNTIKNGLANIHDDKISESDGFVDNFLDTEKNEPSVSEVKTGLSTIEDGSNSLKDLLSNLNLNIDSIIPNQALNKMADSSKDIAEKVSSVNRGTFDIKNTLGEITKTADGLSKVGNLATKTFDSISDIGNEIKRVGNSGDLLGILKTGIDKVFSGLNSIGIDLNGLKDIFDKGAKELEKLGSFFEGAKKFVDSAIKTVTSIIEGISKFATVIDKLTEGIDVLAQVF